MGLGWSGGGGGLERDVASVGSSKNRHCDRLGKCKKFIRGYSCERERGEEAGGGRRAFKA